MAAKSITINFQCGHSEQRKVSGFNGADCEGKARWIGENNDCSQCESLTARPVYREWTGRNGEVRRYVSNLRTLCPQAPGAADAYLTEAGELVTYMLSDDDEKRIALLVRSI